MIKQFKILAIIVACSVSITSFAQKNASDKDTDSAYLKVVTERAAKIVDGLKITDSAKYIRVRDLIAQQYKNLNDIQGIRDGKIKAAKSSGRAKATIDSLVKNIENEVDANLYKLHFEYEAKLLVEITPYQISQVKDGMTYGVLPKTYGAYLDMLPNLTEQQKAQIYAWLYEAREHAMDAGSSEKKHAWFGKYKGRINNYLSAAGIDMKKAGEEWQQRIKARETQGGE